MRTGSASRSRNRFRTWHHSQVHSGPITHRISSRRPNRASMRWMLATLMLLLAALPMVAACGSSNVGGDKLWGRIIVAHRDTGQDKGPNVSVPPALSSVANAGVYKQNGMIGTQVNYTGVTFGQFSQLSDMVVDAFPSDTISMDVAASRSGGTVTFQGTADLTSLKPAEDYVEFAVQFAGKVSASNGTQDDNDTVTWKLAAGKATTMTAESHYDDPSTAGFGGWTFLMIAVALAAVVVVVALARVMRDQTPRYGEPVPTPREQYQAIKDKVLNRHLPRD